MNLTEDPENLLNHAHALAKAKRFYKASAAYTRVIELNDQYVPAYNNLGTVFAALQEHTRALHILRQGLELEPDNPVLLFNYGAVLDARKQYKEAIEVYQKALNQKPDWYEARHNLGIVLCERDQHERALEIFAGILGEDPDNYRIQNNMGVVLLDQGRRQEAVQYFNQALGVAPDYTIAERNLKRAMEHIPAGADRDLKQAFDPADMILITDPYPESAKVSAGIPAADKAAKPYRWDFKNCGESEVLHLLKYLLYLTESLPEQEQNKFRKSTVRSDLEHIIGILEKNFEKKEKEGKNPLDESR